MFIGLRLKLASNSSINNITIVGIYPRFKKNESNVGETLIKAKREREGWLSQSFLWPISGEIS